MNKIKYIISSLFVFVAIFFLNSITSAQSSAVNIGTNTPIITNTPTTNAPTDYYLGTSSIERFPVVYPTATTTWNLNSQNGILKIWTHITTDKLVATPIKYKMWITNSEKTVTMSTSSKEAPGYTGVINTMDNQSYIKGPVEIDIPINREDILAAFGGPTNFKDDKYYIGLEFTDYVGKTTVKFRSQTAPFRIFYNKAPTITLKGDAVMNLDLDSNYVEPGFTAKDPESGDLTNSVKVQNNHGYIRYTVADNDGAGTSTIRNISRPVLFGGMYGFRYSATSTNKSAVFPNPATGNNSCPTGYNDSVSYGTLNVDYELHYCWKYFSKDSTESSVLDFGGMYGLGSTKANQKIRYNNPFTGNDSCPAGYTASQVLGSINKDYPLYLCSRPHVSKTERVTYPYFGGLFSMETGVYGVNKIRSNNIPSYCPRDNGDPLTGYQSSLTFGAKAYSTGTRVDSDLSFCFFTPQSVRVSDITVLASERKNFIAEFIVAFRKMFGL